MKLDLQKESKDASFDMMYEAMSNVLNELIKYANFTNRHDWIHRQQFESILQSTRS